MLDKKRVKSLRTKIENELKELAEDEGIVIKLGTATFSDKNVTFKTIVSTVNDDGSVNTKEGEDFKHYAVRYGLKDTALGATFSRLGEQWTITGCKPRSRKYPILAKNQAGTTYKFDPQSVRRDMDDKSLVLGHSETPAGLQSW